MIINNDYTNYHLTDAHTKFENFKSEFSHLYSEDDWQEIEKHFFRLIDSKDVPSMISQVYSRLGLNTPSVKKYNYHLERIKDIFSLNRNIIEVGGGFLPAFGELVAEEQLKIGKGTITVYDPRLVFNEPKYINMTLHKEYFTTNSDVSNHDLLVGIYPCEATEAIIESAIKNDKDFYVAMCGCSHKTLYNGLYTSSPGEFQNAVINKSRDLIESKGNGVLKVTTMKGDYSNWPILYYKRTK